ncbi:MAG: GIY-YIG nuclease family protein [Bacteroidaceae bacterium]|nr:GIY-YIG nuclease family protein [Bacteroidaceae bacterium]
MAKTIHTILYDDVLDGSKIIEMDNCVCQLSVIRRGYTEFIKEMKEELSKPALYILLNRENRKAYVGETDVFFKRIANHTANKEFWDEALAFTANDNSLTTTEVKYLESLSYETAKQAQSYDLSENSQAPTRPHATKSQEIKIKEFFKYVTLLTKFVGCDLFEKSSLQKHIVQASIPSIPKMPTDLGVKPEDLAGRDVTIKLNGTVYPKSQMGYGVIKEYLKKYPKTSISELKSIFHIGLLGSWGRWNLIEDDLEAAISQKDVDNKYRHLIKEQFILTSGDNVKFVVCNQWDKVNVLNLLRIAKEQGWSYEVVKE